MGKKEKTLSERKMKMALRIAEGIMKVQQKWAEMMAELAGKFSISNQKRILVIGTALASVFCINLIGNSFIQHGGKKATMTIPIHNESGMKLMTDSTRKAGKENFQQRNYKLADSAGLTQNGENR